jgi:hypothetical protein
MAPTFEIKVLDRNSSSSHYTLYISRCPPYLIFHSSITFVTLVSSEISHFLQNATRVNRNRLFGIRIKEGNEKERDIVFPRNSPEG